MLEKIKTLLVTNEMMTAKVLARELNTSEQALQGMLQLLISRGQIEILTGGDCKGSCGCVNSETQAYRWREQKAVTPLSVMSVN